MLHREPENRCLYLGCEITLGVRRSYRYSAEVEAQEKALKAAREVEHLASAAEGRRQTFFRIVRPLKAQAA